MALPRLALNKSLGMIRKYANAKNIVRWVTYVSPKKLRHPQETLYCHGCPAPSTALTCSKTAPEPLGGAALPYFDLDTLLAFAVLALNICKYMEQLHNLDLHYKHGFGMQL